MGALRIPIPSPALTREREYIHFGNNHLREWIEGIARGCITELIGPPSSGITSLACSVLTQATAAGGYCAWVDAADALDPASLVEAGAVLPQMVWVRCGGQLGNALQAADWLLHGGGFSLLVLDVCGIDMGLLRRTPASYWYRFKRAVENTPTALLVLARESQARSCAAAVVECDHNAARWAGTHPQFLVLEGTAVTPRMRKPPGRTPGPQIECCLR
jgi:hypothetical protein